MNKSQGATLNNSVQEGPNSNVEASKNTNDTDVIEPSKESSTGRKTYVKILEKNLDANDPAHHEFFKALMSKKNIKNTSVRRQFRRWLLLQIRELVGNELVGKFEAIHMVDTYYIRLHSIYDMTFQKFLDAYVRCFGDEFPYSYENWENMVREARQKNDSKRRRIKVKQPYQHY